MNSCPINNFKLTKNIVSTRKYSVIINGKVTLDYSAITLSEVTFNKGKK